MTMGIDRVSIVGYEIEAVGSGLFVLPKICLEIGVINVDPGVDNCNHNLSTALFNFPSVDCVNM